MFSIVLIIVGLIILAVHHNADDYAECSAAPKRLSVTNNYFSFDLKELLFGSLSRTELDNRAPPA